MLAIIGDQDESYQRSKNMMWFDFRLLTDAVLARILICHV